MRGADHVPAARGRRSPRAGRGGHGRHRTPLGVALALLAAAVGAGFGAGLPAPATAAGDGDPVRFTVALTNEVDSFNPFLGIEAESYEMWALTYDYLIGYDMETMAPVPTGLAEDWQTSADGLTWTFTLRDGVTWSDGEPLTAADVTYTFDRILDGGPEAATWGSYLTSVESVEAPDDTTVVLSLSRPNAVLPLLPIPIVPEHIWRNVDEQAVKSYAAEPQDGEPVVGSGPFRFVEGTAGGSTYRFEANPDYWQGAPYVDEVVFRVFKSDDPAVQALLKGEVDFVEEISPIAVERLQSEEGITAQNGDSPSFDEIAFNTGARDPETEEPIGDGNPVLQDPAFRYALGFALDRDVIIERAYQGGGRPGSVIVPPAYTNFRWEPPADVAQTFDLERAGRLLDEAGYTLGGDGLRTMPDGSPIGTLRLYARSDSAANTSLKVLDLFSEWLGEIGIESEVSTFESSKLTDIILEGNFDVFEWGWYVEPDPDSMLSYFTCDQRGGWSDSWYCDEEYDAMYAQQNAEVDDAARVETVKAMQEKLYLEAPYLVTAYSTIGEAVRSDRWACLQPQPDPGGVWLQQYGAHNYLAIRPADEAGDCDGVASALRPAAATVGGGGDGGDAGVSTGLLVGGGVALLLLLGAGAVLAVRRRSSAGDRA